MTLRRWVAIGGVAMVALVMLAGVYFSPASFDKLPHLPVADTLLDESVTPTPFKLWDLSLGSDGHVYGARAQKLYRIVDNASAVEELYRFDQPITGIHQTQSGILIVATDADPRDNSKPCLIYRSVDSGQHFELIKTMTTGTALHWSLTSDVQDRIFVGEYGPKQIGMGKTVWRSDDLGDSWQAVFNAPNHDEVHIHRVAVDPYTQDIWVTVGDAKNRAMHRSQDLGQSWQLMARDQSTSVAFLPDSIYWGRDKSSFPGITQFDRQTQRFCNALSLEAQGNYGGSIYTMASDASGAVYAATMKYADQGHAASIWRGHEGQWQPLMLLQSDRDKSVGVRIAGPDQDGWIYITGYKIRAQF